jgi:hypothetical protein
MQLSQQLTGRGESQPAGIVVGFRNVPAFVPGFVPGVPDMKRWQVWVIVGGPIVVYAIGKFLSR